MSNFLKEGVIFSFCLAFVASIYFDAHFQNKHSEGIEIRYFEDLAFKLFPCVIFLVTVCITTAISLLSEKTEINNGLMINSQILMVVV